MTTSSPTPDHIGRYQVLERVGAGGMGVLYRGYDPKLDREVAIKVMLTDFSEDAEAMRPRFYREAKAVAKLQHRNIVTVFEFVEDQKQPHIVMEFLRGVSLASRMKTQPALTVDDKLDIVAQLCSGLGYAHSQGVVHRDVKPANLFLLEDGTVKLLDFGIAKLTSSNLTRQGDVLGSASYMSPEQVAGSDSVDGRADVWSSGVVLYELLAGKKPFEGETPTNVIVKILKEEPPPIETLVFGLPKQLIAAVHHALQKDPAKRIGKADELSRELQWIRKALQASGELAPMEETRFASTQVLKALSEDIKKIETGQLKIPTRIRPGAAAEAAAPQPAASSSKKWIVPAALAATVAASLTGYLMFGRSSSTASTVNGSGANNAAISTPAPAPPASNAATPTPTAPAPPPTAKPTASSGSPAANDSQTARGTEKTSAVARAGGSGATIPEPSTDAKPAPATDTRKPTPTGPLVKVAMSAPYAFEVMDGSRTISASSRTHELSPQPVGKMLRIVAPDVFLDRQVRVEAGAGDLFEYQPPALGRLIIRARRGDCKIVLGKRELGDTSVTIPVVAGEYLVKLACPDGQNPEQTAIVSPGQDRQVPFK